MNRSPHDAITTALNAIEDEGADVPTIHEVLLTARRTPNAWYCIAGLLQDSDLPAEEGTCDWDTAKLGLLDALTDEIVNSKHEAEATDDEQEQADHLGYEAAYTAAYHLVDRADPHTTVDFTIRGERYAITEDAPDGPRS